MQTLGPSPTEDPFERKGRCTEAYACVNAWSAGQQSIALVVYRVKREVPCQLVGVEENVAAGSHTVELEK